MLVIRTGRIEIASGTGPLTATEMVWFPNDVIGECWVGLAGLQRHLFFGRPRAEGARGPVEMRRAEDRVRHRRRRDRDAPAPR